MEIENRRLQEKIVEDEHIVTEFTRVTQENEMLRSDSLSKAEDLKSTRATVAKLDGANKTLSAEKASFEKEVSKLKRG